MAYKKNVWKSKDRITKEKLNNIEEGIYEAHRIIGENGENKDLSLYQLKEDNSLLTSNKNITGAINELFQSTNITGKILTIDNKKYILSKDNNGNITATIINGTSYTITRNLSNCTSSNTTNSVNQGASYSATITPNSGYELINVAITMGGANVTSSVYTYQNGNAVINIPSVTGNVVITVQVRASSSSGGSGGNPGSGTSYTITRNLTNCTSSNTSSSVNQGASYSATITPNSGYTLSSITVTMNGTDITDTAVNIKTDTSNTNVSGETLSVSGETLSVSGETLSISGTISEESLSVSGTSSDATGYAVINIPSVTGNIVISAIAVEITSGGSDPVSGDVLSYMTYGKDISQTTAEIRDNPECWATINPVTIKNGTTYTISVDGTFLWVLAIDDSGNPVVPFLTTGTNSNPQSFTFTATTSKIKFGCYDPNHTVTYCTLTESSSSGGSGGNPGSGTSYTITRNLTNCTSSNTTGSVTANSSYSTTITANSGYTLGSITVTMGGTNITSSAVSGNSISISNVTGNIVISCTATSSSSGGSTPSTGSDLTGTYLFFGDSICAGGGSNGYGYPEAVKAVQTSMTKINYAVSGTCIAKNDSYDVKYPSILSRIQGSTPYADYVVLEGGFNDSWGQRNPLGTLKSGSAPTTANEIKTYSASLNEYQYTDALEKCICEIKLKYWGKKIFFVIPHTVDAAVYANTYHSRAVEVCNKWGVIVIDLRNCGMPSYQDGTYNVDGTHPSAAGYDKYFAPNIIKVLKANK